MHSFPKSKSGEEKCVSAFGFIRACLVGLIVVTAAVGGAIHNAQARVGESLIAFGDQLSAWTSGKLDSKVGHLTVNGVLIHRVTASTPLGVDDALTRLGHVCTERGGIERTEELLAPSRSSEGRNPLGGTVRHVTEHEGVLACIDTERPLSVVELSHRLQQFVKSGDLATVGQLRYVLARREGNVTSLLVLWTDGSVPLLKMFPQSGDAPGQDVPCVPRPEGSSRLLSAMDQGSLYAITVYRSHRTSPRQIRDFYTKTLTPEGWFVTEIEAGSVLARRGSRAVLIHAANISSGNTTTSIVDLS